MSFKEALIKGLKVEGAENGFETFIGWAAMAEAVAIVVLGVVLGRKSNDGAGK